MGREWQLLDTYFEGFILIGQFGCLQTVTTVAVYGSVCLSVCPSVSSVRLFLSVLQERYSEMGGKKFLYGTHYSAPGYVLYFLVRTGIGGCCSHSNTIM